MKMIGNENSARYQYRIGESIYIDSKQMKKVQRRALKRACQMLGLEH